MPKDKQTKVEETPKEEPKKKVVVVEEVEDENTSVDSEVENQENNSKFEEVNVKTEANTPETKNTLNEIQEEVEDDEVNDKPKYLWIIVPTALLVGALVGGLITYFSGISNMNTNSNEVVSTSTPSAVATNIPESQATATPSSSLKKETLKVQVLNGSGISGLAGKVKTMLEGLGYKSVSVGNASSSSFEQTEVAVKESKNEYLDVLIKDLSKDYDAVEAKKPLSASSSYDVVITLGSK
jgi:hypothetical protein